jgi:hypothetical protein
MYDLSSMTDRELAQLLRRLNERNDRYAYEEIRHVVAEITRRQMAAEGERR